MMNIKIALPTRNGQIDDHFGHCAYYTVFDVDTNNQITNKTRMESPEGCGCKSGIAPVMKEMGIRVMLAGNMGQGAINVLQNNDITVIRGCKGDVDEVIKAYLNGQLHDNAEVCDHHDCPSHEHEEPSANPIFKVNF